MAGSGTNRDDFPEAIKRLLAERVAYRCSFLGGWCPAATVGPAAEAHKRVLLGQAAHITAAAPGGPRYDPALTTQQRRAAENGIWMCLQHARLIDDDKTHYSVQQLREWKEEAEGRAADALMGIHNPAPSALTLVGLGLEHLIEAEWSGASAGVWRFRLVRHVLGTWPDLAHFLEHVSSYAPHERVVVMEELGAGRLLGDDPSWQQNDGVIELRLPINPPPPRRDPGTIGRSPVMGDHDFEVDEHGRFRMVEGADSGMQRLRNVLHYPLGYGSPIHSAEFGSLWPRRCRQFADDDVMLGRLLALEVARLSASPLPPGPGALGMTAVLDFVERVEAARIVGHESAGQIVVAQLETILVGGTQRSDTLRLKIVDDLHRWVPAESEEAEPQSRVP